MKRLALVLAALLPTAGCFSGECSRSVTVAWPSFVLADATSTSSCQAAGVSAVDVWVNGAYAGSFHCGDGAAEVGLAHGSNVVTVEGIDAGGTILYRDEVSVGAASCGSSGTLATHPGEGLVSVSYTFSPTNACYTPGPSFVWVYVWDDLAQEVAADSSAAPESGDVCGVNFPMTFRLASGDYTLSRTQEMVRGAAAGTYATVGRDCTHYAFRVAAGATTPLTPVLGDASSSCP